MPATCPFPHHIGCTRNLKQISFYLFLNFFTFFLLYPGSRGGVVIKALRYKPAGRGFDSRWCHWNFTVS
jgi:hypothetical protein